MIEGLLTTHDELQERVAELEALRAGLALQVAERTAALEAAKSDLANNLARLEAANSAQGRFFTNVSHEFKTPLTLMISVVEELERGERSPQQAAAALRRHAGGLLALINELLDFARIDSGKMPLRPSPFVLTEALGATLAELEPLAAARSLTLRPSWPAEPLPVELDRTLVTRAVLNLVVNAIKYIRPGDCIEVRARPVGTERVAIEVIDTGPGIAVEEQAKIAERFGRAVDADGRAIGGSGIGLAMVHEIAELHRGALQLESRAGAGATFRLDLPRVLAIAANEGGPAAAPDADGAQVAVFLDAAQSALLPERAVHEPDRSEAAAPRRELPARVLVVDDNEELRGWMARIVGREHVVETAADGFAALELAHTWRPDVVVSDVMMPRLDGFGPVRAIRAEAELQHTGVILVTARHGREPLLQGFEARCDDFLQKPFAADELLARVDTQVRLRRLQRALIRAGRAQLLSALSAGMAHEVLNPVNALLERDGADWLVAVDDDGPGVPEERRGAIFEPFVTTKDPGPGTGMGLAIAREIAELHSGSLRLGRSRLGGARFEPRIPRQEPGR